MHISKWQRIAVIGVAHPVTEALSAEASSAFLTGVWSSGCHI